MSRAVMFQPIGYGSGSGYGYGDGYGYGTVSASPRTVRKATGQGVKQ